MEEGQRTQEFSERTSSYIVFKSITLWRSEESIKSTLLETVFSVSMCESVVSGVGHCHVKTPSPFPQEQQNVFTLLSQSCRGKSIRLSEKRKKSQRERAEREEDWGVRAKSVRRQVFKKTARGASVAMAIRPTPRAI